MRKNTIDMISVLSDTIKAVLSAFSKSRSLPASLVLSDRKRPGAPATFTPEQILATIDLACKDPCSFGYEVSHWSLSLLTSEIKKQGIAERISEKSVSRFLKMR